MVQFACGSTYVDQSVYVKIYGQLAKSCMQMKVYQLGIAILVLYIFSSMYEDNSCNNTCFLLEVMLASIEVVLRCMPKKFRVNCESHCPLLRFHCLLGVCFKE